MNNTRHQYSRSNPITAAVKTAKCQFDALVNLYTTQIVYHDLDAKALSLSKIIRTILSDKAAGDPCRINCSQIRPL
jgi:hypothetical protein